MQASAIHEAALKALTFHRRSARELAVRAPIRTPDQIRVFELIRCEIRFIDQMIKHVSNLSKTPPESHDMALDLKLVGCGG